MDNIMVAARRGVKQELDEFHKFSIGILMWPNYFGGREILADFDFVKETDEVLKAHNIRTMEQPPLTRH